jgi:hypothetical protein
MHPMLIQITPLHPTISNLLRTLTVPRNASNYRGDAEQTDKHQDSLRRKPEGRPMKVHDGSQDGMYP